MDASPLAARPRLNPGIPAGGVAALAVTLAMVGWGIVAGGSSDSSFDFDFDPDQGRAAFSIPAPPAPPSPPAPPRAPAGPGDIVVRVDAEAIRRAVEEGLRAGDFEAVRREAMRAAEQARGAQADAMAALSGIQAHGGTLKASFTAPKGVRLVDFTGDVRVEVSRRADKVSLEVEGAADTLRTSVVDGALTLVGRGDARPGGDMTLVVPPGADLSISGLAGDLTIDGNTDGRLTLDLRRGDVTADRLQDASVTVREAGSFTANRVEGQLAFSTQGHGELTVDRAGTLTLDVVGAAEVKVGRVQDGLTLSIPGHADVTVDRVEGPVKANLPGAGSVRINGGTASPLKVASTGAAEFHFDGTAENPEVLAAGVGNVHVARHTGTARVQNIGQGKAVVGD